MSSRQFLVSGRVQGVGFRAFARREIQALGMVGSATNLDDGRVDVRASGTPKQLDALEEALWRGPILAHVTAIDVRDET